MKKSMLAYLWFFSRSLLNRFKPQIIAVTGPAGKTSTKDLIYTLLNQSKRFQPVARSFGNLNTKWGVPLALLQIRAREPNDFTWLRLIIYLPVKWLVYQLKILPYPRLIVLEVAADKKREIEFIASQIKPRVAVLTSVGAAHLEFFKTVDNLMKEKQALFIALPKDGLAVLPDRGLKRVWLDKLICRKLFFNPQDLKAAARLVGEYFGLTTDQIQRGLVEAQPQPGRFNVFQSARGWTVIDDSYNANPVSVAASLNFLARAAREKRARRRIVLLADMLELGQAAKKWHQKVGRLVKKKSDRFIAFGDLARYYQADIYFDRREKLIDYLLSQLREGDIILVKGSRRMEMEKIAARLK